MNEKYKASKGYSLIEILFVVVIFSIIGLAIIKISNFSWKSYTYSKEHSIIQRNRTAIQKIINNTRNALQININSSGQQMILRTLDSNNKNTYQHYILAKQNLYLYTNDNPNFIKNLNNLKNKPQLIIGEKIISNNDIFSFTKKELVSLNFKFKKQVDQDNKDKIKLSQSIHHKVYPRNRNININLKSQSEVQQ